MADRVEPELQHVGNQQELATWGVHRVFPDLLYWALVAAWHDGIEIGRVRPLQLDRRDNGFGDGVEMAQRSVGGTTARTLFVVDRPFNAIAEGLVAENFYKEALDEWPTNLGFLLLAQRAAAYRIRPVAQAFLVFWRGGLRERPLVEKTPIEQWDVK